MDTENDNQSNKPEPISPDWVHEQDAEDTSLEEVKKNLAQPDDIGLTDSPDKNEEPINDTNRVVLRTPVSDNDNALDIEASPVVEEITDQVRISLVTKEMLSDPIPTGKTVPVVTRPALASTDGEIDLDEFEESLNQQKKTKRFLGMSAGQRFFFFLFLLIIIVVLGTLFLALSGKVSLPFLMGLFP